MLTFSSLRVLVLVTLHARPGPGIHRIQCPVGPAAAAAASLGSCNKKMKMSDVFFAHAVRMRTAYAWRMPVWRGRGSVAVQNFAMAKFPGAQREILPWQNSRLRRSSFFRKYHFRFQNFLPRRRDSGVCQTSTRSTAVATSSLRRRSLRSLQ